MLLNFQQKYSFVSRSFDVAVSIVLFIVVERALNTDEQRHNPVGSYYRFLNFCIKKQRRGRKLLYILLQLPIVNLIKKGFSMYLKRF